MQLKIRHIRPSFIVKVWWGVLLILILCQILLQPTKVALGLQVQSGLWTMTAKFKNKFELSTTQPQLVCALFVNIYLPLLEIDCLLGENVSGRIYQGLGGI